MGMADADGQGIGGMGGHPFFDAEQSLYHGADLLLARLPITANRLLDLCGRILVHGNPNEGGRQERYPSGLSQEECGTSIPREEHLLDGHVVRAEFLEEFLKVRMDS